MGLKSILIVLVVLMAAVGAPLMVEAQLGNIIGNLLGLISVQGTVFCTADGNMGLNGTATPIFPNAAIQLKCGDQNIVSTATTNNLGTFSIILNPLQLLIPSLLSNCNVVVNTPLSNCNVTLPSTGSLVSPLRLAGSTLQGLVKIFNIVPGVFTFIS